MINIIKTGSKGNAVLINSSILIDIGVSFKELESYYKDIKYVLLTHIHADHFNKSTIKKLAFERPNVKFICCEWLLKDLADIVALKQIFLIETRKLYNFDGLQLIAEETKHNVRNCCYKILTGGKKIFFATDLNNLDNIQAKEYDYYLIEANFSEETLIKRIKEKIETGEYIYEYDVLKNHLSQTKAMEFILNNAGVDSEYILLHQHEGEVNQ